MSALFPGQRPLLSSQLRRTIALLSVAAPCIAVSTPAEAQETRTTTSRNIEEVIVTAQKRAENLQNVPIAISVLSGSELEESSDTGVAEAVNRVPGVVNIPNSGQVRFGGNSSVVVRGVTPTGRTVEGAVAYYIDGAPFFGRSAPDSSAYDLKQVEVLRGPQGTLYGAGALNGVVRILTADPNLTDFEFKARSGTSSVRDGGIGYLGDLALNIPLVEDKLAVRAVAGYQNRAGWIDRPGEDDANNRELTNARLRLKSKPTEDLTIDVLTWISRERANQPDNSLDGLTTTRTADEVAKNDFDLFQANVIYDFSAFSLSSATTYIETTQYSVIDVTPFFPPGGTIVTDFPTHSFAEEINLTSTSDGPWRWTLGGMYNRSRSTTDQFSAELGYAAPDRFGTKSESFALFGELTRALIDDRLDLTGGLRYYEDKRTDFVESVFLVPGGIPPGGLSPPVERKFDRVSPRVVLTWHPANEASVYASYSQGFRSGSNPNPSVLIVSPGFPSADPDTLNSYEIGAKGTLLDGALSLEAAAFYQDWQDIQQDVGIFVTSTFITSAPINLGSASGFGVELAASVRPTENLVLSGSIGWNDLAFDKEVIGPANGFPVGSAVLARKGARLAGSPERTASGSGEYAFPLGNRWRGAIGGSVRYVSEIINSRSLTGQVFSQEKLLISQANISIQAPENWSASLYVDNLSNEKGKTLDPFPEWSSWLSPRTVGIHFQYKY